jgi:hypothetical protein
LLIDTSGALVRVVLVDTGQEEHLLQRPFGLPCSKRHTRPLT